MPWILQMSVRINFSSIFAHPTGFLRTKRKKQTFGTACFRTDKFIYNS